MQVFRTQNAAEVEAAVRIEAKPTGVTSIVSGLWSFSNRKPIGAAGGAALIAVVSIGVLTRFAGLAPHDQDQVGLGVKFLGPNADLLLGTDQLGRDTLSRFMFGAWISMKVGLVNVLIGITAGTLIGIFSA